MIKLNEQGLTPAIMQDISTKEILTLGYVNPSSLKRTMEDRQMWFYSRSREDLWHKGETSGHYMNIKDTLIDCDGDALLFQVEPEGPACHTGNPTCFFTPLSGDELEFQTSNQGSGILEELFAIIQERKRDMPEGSYTANLLKAGVNRVAQKVVEEAGESAVAAASGKSEDLPGEVADLLYHTLVLLSVSGMTPEAVWKELRRRRER